MAGGKEEGAGSREGDTAKVVGECRYCGKAILHKERLLPLECLECKHLFHVRCLRGAKPPVFLGDNLYRFTCAFCGSLGKETWERPNLQWYVVCRRKDEC
jgi:cytochrome c1